MPKVLIIDDEPDWRETLEVPLLPLGYDTRTVSTRSEALRLIEREVFDLVVLNVRLEFGIKEMNITSQWTLLLDTIRFKQEQAGVIIVTSASYPSSIALYRLQRMAFKDYEVSDFFIKEEFNVREYREIVEDTIRKNLALMSGEKSETDAHQDDGVEEFDVFLAYNPRELPTVKKIAEKLKQRRITFGFQAEQLPPGRSRQEFLEQAISRGKSAAIFIGPGGMEEWQTAQLRAFIGRCVESGLPVIPVLLPGTTEIPDPLWFLKELHAVTFKTLEDVEALDNLQWGITGIHPKHER